MKNTRVAVYNNYTILVYNITIQLIWKSGVYEWSYKAKGVFYNLTCLEPNNHEWMYKYITDERVEHLMESKAWGWIKNE